MIAMKYMEDTSKQEILQAISGVSRRMDKNEGEVMEAIGSLAEQLEDVRTDVQGLRSDMSDVKHRLTHVEIQTTTIGSRVATIGSQMVTKGYLDDKLSDLRSDMVGYMKKSDSKTNVLIKELERSGSLRKESAKRVLAIDPFSRVV